MLVKLVERVQFAVLCLMAGCTTAQGLNHSDSLLRDAVQVSVRLMGVRYQRFDVSGDIDGIGSFVYGVMVVKNSGHSAISFDRDDYHLYVSGFLSKKPEPQWSPAVATCTVFLPPNGEIEYKVYWFFDAYVPVDDLNRSVVQFVPPTSDRPPCRF